MQYQIPGDSDGNGQHGQRDDVLSFISNRPLRQNFL